MKTLVKLYLINNIHVNQSGTWNNIYHRKKTYTREKKIEPQRLYTGLYYMEVVFWRILWKKWECVVHEGQVVNILSFFFCSEILLLVVIYNTSGCSLAAWYVLLSWSSSWHSTNVNQKFEWKKCAKLRLKGLIIPHVPHNWKR